MKKSRSIIITLILSVLILSISCYILSSSGAQELVADASNSIQFANLLRATPNATVESQTHNDKMIDNNSASASALPSAAIASESHQQNTHLRAASGATIEFKTQNGKIIDNVPSQTKRIPHLVLHRNGTLTSADERTLFIELIGIEVPAPGITVTLMVETQNGDPDLGEDVEYRIPVWHETKWIPNTKQGAKNDSSTLYKLMFEHNVVPGRKTLTTPTGYFRIEVLTTGPGDLESRTFDVQEYAFLMEDQVVAPLPQVAEYTNGAAPDELIVTYSDMIPFQNRNANGTSRIARAEVPNYVQKQLAPRFITIFQVQTDEWGFPWHEEWTSFRDDEYGERLSVTLSDGQTWYHGRAPRGAHSAITLNVKDNLGIAHYDSLTERLLSIYKHELFHNLQRNIAQHYSGSGYLAGKTDSWTFFSEGTAILAQLIDESPTELSRKSGDGAYLLNGNKYVASNSLKGNLNSSYAKLDTFSTAIYWRFLYEQCGGIGIIRQVLVTLYSGTVADIHETSDLVGWFPAILDHSLANASCPFTTYRDSLNAFAYVLYTLHVQEDQCKDPGGSGICCLYDPENEYQCSTNRKLSYSGNVFSYGAAEQTQPAGIRSSFGIDFIEIELDPGSDGQSVTLEVYGEERSAATFNVQVWELTSTGKQNIPTGESVTVTVQDDGHLVCTIPTIDRSTVQRLAVIITRVDSQESTDLVGAYTLVMRPGTE